MLPSTKALVRLAILPVSIAAIAGCQPGSDQVRLLGAVGLTAEATSFLPSVGGSTVAATPTPGSALSSVEQVIDVTAGPDSRGVGSAAAELLVQAERQDAPTAPSEPTTPAPAPAPVGPAIAPFAAFAAGPPSAVVTGAMGTLNWLAAGDRAAYTTGLAALSRSVGEVTGVSADALLMAWNAAGDLRMEALLAALTQVGVSYSYASSTPGRAFDCSGLVSWAWGLAGTSLPHQSSAIIDSLPHGDIATVLPADVLWYPGHVSLALGVSDAYIDAPNSGNTVRIEGGHSASAARRLVVGVVA